MSLLAVENRKVTTSDFVLKRHLNKLRWLVLSIVFALLVLIPFLHVYQTYLDANAYDLLNSDEKLVYNTMEILTAPFTNEPATDLDNFKGTTWSGALFGIKLSDPLAVIANFSATLRLHWPLVLTVIIPVLLTVVLGRVFCGWICPATFLYELNDNLGTLLYKVGFPVGRWKFDLRWKYGVLFFGIIISASSGAALFSNIYPPAIIGRELYYAIALGGFGVGSALFLATMGLDLLVARRGFCRYICPGGALYSILGRYRLFRIKREVTECNDCAKCNTACQFDLDPMRDNFGQECNNCTACMAVCPTDTLQFTVSVQDVSFQGPGHLGRDYKKTRNPGSVSKSLG